MEAIKSFALFVLIVVAAAAMLFGTYAAAVTYYAAPAVKWAAVAAYAAAAFLCSWKRRWGWAAVFAAGIPAVLSLYPLFTDIEAKARNGANVGSLSALRGTVAASRDASGSFPAELTGYRLRLGHGHPETTEVRLLDAASPEALAQDLGTWAYDPRTGKVFIACTHPGDQQAPWNTR